MFFIRRLRALNAGPDAFGEAGDIGLADGSHRNRLAVRLESDGFERWVFGKDFDDRTGHAERRFGIGDFGFG